MADMPEGHLQDDWRLVLGVWSQGATVTDIVLMIAGVLVVSVIGGLFVAAALEELTRLHEESVQRLFEPAPPPPPGGKRPR